MGYHPYIATRPLGIKQDHQLSAFKLTQSQKTARTAQNS